MQDESNTRFRNAEVAQCRTMTQSHRSLPTHSQAVFQLGQAQQKIAAMIERHQLQDEAIQLWYENAPMQTLADLAYRGTEILKHDYSHALESARTYRQAAETAQRVGDTTLAMKLEQDADDAEVDVEMAKQGLSDVLQILESN